ncbi:FG-GAP repeat protein [Saccharospirillum salsuginis]|uniref:FG-GAP repeat-containing protein n=1 Tax=Saccharospirillum salsuginis TaxID=418750 RepID=A0A918NKD3_9GAMM|nr:FG-GAP repeat protein [Saccharospirillum salsuginis]GGX74813.1 hypothetical protein GCM10007392_47610 [Saccharospirillum salsuginis]
MLTERLKITFFMLSSIALVSACENGIPEIPDDPPDPDGSFEVSVSVEGLKGKNLKLQLNEGEVHSIPENGSYTFDGFLKTGETYQVLVDTNPVQPNQECVVENGDGTVEKSDVDDVLVQCNTLKYMLGGIVNGLSGGELVLKTNSNQTVRLTHNGEFAFPEPVLDGSEFTTEIEDLPKDPTQVCSLTNANGVVAGGDYLDIIVDCSVKGYTLSGEVSGLLGSGLVLVNNESDSISISDSGQFEFNNEVADGTDYSVAIDTQPQSPNQVCQIQNANGTISGADVNSLSVSCITSQYSLHGRIVGLKGEGLDVTVNGEKLETSIENGALEILAGLDDYSEYSVSVSNQPTNPSQICDVSNGSGKVDGANVDDILIVCETGSFAVGGSVSGLEGSGLVIQLNGEHDLAVESDGSFAFSNTLEDQSDYSVTIASQPTSPEQSCRVTNGSGRLTGSEVSNILVSCNNTYAIGGTLEGLAEETNVVLQLNGQDDLSVDTNGSFVFPVGLKTGEEYTVSVKAHPQGPNQNCTLTNPTGTVDSRDVLEVGVSCETLAYKVGVEVSGLLRSGLVLQNNGGDNLVINSDGVYQFDQPVPDYETYEISVLKTPEDLLHRCDIDSGTGQIDGAAVTGVKVNCNLGIEVDGVISGLAEGNSVTLTNNETDTLVVAENGVFVFDDLLILEEEYSVEVEIQPDSVPQVCGVENGSGTADAYDKYEIEVSCLLPKPDLSIAPEPVKKLHIEWNKVPGVEEYRLFENKDSQSGFEQIASFDGDVSSYHIDLAVLNRLDAQYMLEACAAGECASSQTVLIDENVIQAVGYFKASNTGQSDNFGNSIAISGDGSTMAVGARMEQSSAQGINGDQSDNTLTGAGAVYIYTKISDQWVQQAYIKPSNTHGSQYFGDSVGLNETGDLLVVGAPGDSSAATGIDGDQASRSAPNSGAVFVYSQNSGAWHQESYIKASNSRSGALFGNAVSLSRSGDIVAVGSKGENSGDPDNPEDTSSPGSGAVYKFQRGVGGQWQQTDYVNKAKYIYGSSDNAAFGASLDCDEHCNELVVAAPGLDKVYYITSRKTVDLDLRATGIASVAFDNDGDILVGSSSFNRVDRYEWGLHGSQFGTAHRQKLTPKYPVENASFGSSLAVSTDGLTLVVGAPGERMDASGINDIPIDNGMSKSGAVYVYERQRISHDFEEADVIYIKPLFNDSSNFFGTSVAVSNDGEVLGISASGEAGNSLGIGGDQEDNSMPYSGSVFMY